MQTRFTNVIYGFQPLFYEEIINCTVWSIKSWTEPILTTLDTKMRLTFLRIMTHQIEVYIWGIIHNLHNATMGMELINNVHIYI